MFFFTAFPATSACAAVRVEGLNEWLTAGAERSLEAVYDHIASSETTDTKKQLLTVVADRLLPGFTVDSVSFRGVDVTVRLRTSSSPPRWDVALIQPNLSPPVDSWFNSDTADLGERISPMMDGVPVEALSWGDMDLKRTMDGIFEDRLPGWRVSLMVRNVADGAILEISFVPEQPLTLAVTSSISSSSIPVVLHSNLKDDLLSGFAPVIGIPVPWLERHRDDFALLGKNILAEEKFVENAKAQPEISVRPGPISEVDIDLESRRYAAWVWMAVYAGAADRYPEIGLHFGRRAQILPRWDMELYTELIVTLDDWDLETRLGMRWSPWRSVWLGAEWSDLDNAWWMRASIDPKTRSPYAWIRCSDGGETDGALGYRINDFISIEVHYDSRSSDPWNVRALVNL
ncbi:MAG: hypothetical protein LBT31_01270 [Synergistaceae bacterium]|nr:hypothetical protein [Synergistaceae bacterium]